MPELPTLERAVDADGLVRFHGLLQRGAAVRVPAGLTVQGFLTVELGLDPAYVTERITTLFLDGRVVDRPEEAALHDGAILALSAAMPGLVGATLRRSGFYAAMRSAITHRAAASRGPGGSEHLVRVKLFNLLLAELGPVLLARGIVLGRAAAEDLLGAALGPGAPPDVLELRVRLA